MTDSSISLSTTDCPIPGTMEWRADKAVGGWYLVEDGMNFGHLKSEKAVERS